jgi:hypothetical protein
MDGLQCLIHICIRCITQFVPKQMEGCHLKWTRTWVTIHVSKKPNKTLYSYQFQLTPSTYSTQTLKTDTDVRKNKCNEQTIDMGWNWNWNKTIRVFLTAQSRGVKPPLRRVADQHFGRSEGDRGAGCWAERKQAWLRIDTETERMETINYRSIIINYIHWTSEPVTESIVRPQDHPAASELRSQTKGTLLLGCSYHHCACSHFRCIVPQSLFHHTTSSVIAFAFRSFSIFTLLWISLSLNDIVRPYILSPPPPMLYSLFHPLFVSLASLLLSFHFSLSFFLNRNLYLPQYSSTETQWG